MAKKDKPSIIRWRGVLCEATVASRVMAFVALLVLAATLSFMQFGFLGVGLPGDYSGYAFVMLAPIALSALLLGIPGGFLAGLLMGAVMYAHSVFQPLDYYEVAFITPGSSIGLFAFIGLLFGLLFAIALRKDPPLWRRIVYIVVVCLIVSVVVSTLFMTGVIVQLAVQLGTDETFISSSSEAMVAEAQARAIEAAVRVGNIGLQVAVDITLPALACIAADIAVRRAHATKENRSMRTTFRAWLLFGVALAFTTTAGLSFAVVTEQERQEADKLLESETKYLANQIAAQENREKAISTLLDEAVFADDTWTDANIDRIITILSIQNLVDGYTVEDDGIIIVAYDEYVLLSDDADRFKEGDKLDDHFDKPTMRAIEESKATGEARRIVYDSSDIVLELNDEDGIERVTTALAFLRAREVGDYSIVMILPSHMAFANRAVVMMWITLSAFVLLLVVFVIASRLLTRLVVNRIDETNGVLARITEGDLDARVDIRDNREFRSLSEGVNTTVDTLKSWISEAETRMDTELSTAKAIQESALPRIFPPYPDILRFDIYASMKAAREVGGDFYDFFLVGDDSTAAEGKLGFVIADVSGKGVPAALFMMTAKTEVRNFLESGMPPGEAIENANRQLCEGNDAGMFVTVFAGVLDYGTGHVSYVNAGHNPPLLWRDGAWSWVKDISGMPLGLFDGFPYETFETDLCIGDQFLLYTDGVTEAMDVEGNLYGEERLEALAAEKFFLHPRRLIREVRASLVAYTRGAEQSDDITMLALEYGVPPEHTSTLVVPASVDELPHVMDFVHSELDRRLCPMKTQKQLDIALEELFVNVAHYAYPDATPDKPGTARISYTYSADPPSVTIEIADDGIPYDPLAKPDAVTPDDIMDVPIGGLGILMAKQSVDEMSYKRLDNSNIVTFKKKW